MSKIEVHSTDEHPMSCNACHGKRGDERATVFEIAMGTRKQSLTLNLCCWCLGDLVHAAIDQMAFAGLRQSMPHESDFDCSAKNS